MPRGSLKWARLTLCQARDQVKSIRPSHLSNDCVLTRFMEFMAIELLEATVHTYRVYDISQFGDSHYRVFENSVGCSFATSQVDLPAEDASIRL